jgi:antitoxin component of MazEF toxin-antitoxin module
MKQAIKRQEGSEAITVAKNLLQQIKVGVYRKLQIAKDNNDDIGMLSVNDNDISLSSCEDSSSSIVPSVNESTDDEITSSLVSLGSDGTIDDDEVLQDDKDISLSYTFNVDELEKFLNEGNALLQPKDCNDFIHHDSSLLTVGAFAEKFMEICEFNNINETGML